jgi:predicted dienelactone hydrolase
MKTLVLNLVFGVSLVLSNAATVDPSASTSEQAVSQRLKQLFEATVIFEDIEIEEKSFERAAAKVYLPASWQQSPDKPRPLIVLYDGIGSYADALSVYSVGRVSCQVLKVSPISCI